VAQLGARTLTIQSNFKVTGSVQYKKIKDESGLCTLEWNERTNNAAGAGDVTVGQWQDHIALRPDAEFEGDPPMWEEWNKAKVPDSACKEKKDFSILDRPALSSGTGAAANVSRILEIEIVLKSGCKSCEIQELKVFFIQDISIQGQQDQTLVMSGQGPVP
jgi:hypothetical protein